MKIPNHVTIFSYYWILERTYVDQIMNSKGRKNNVLRLVSISALAALFLGALLWFHPPDPPTVRTAVLVNDDVTYHLHQPDRTAALSKELDEASGLAYVTPNTLAMVNDEEGEIYLWDTQTDKIIEEIDFGKDGDYEGLAIDGTTAYVLRSDGDVYQVTSYRQNPATTKYENPLSDDNDTEGLWYDTPSNSLLIACKATGQTKSFPDAESTLVYQYALESPDTLVPWLTLDGPRVHPSGIARHPRTHCYYVLASADRQLLVFSPERTLLQRTDLPKKLFPQPEGICFTPDGTLYIANERRKNTATLLQFNPILHP